VIDTTRTITTIQDELISLQQLSWIDKHSKSVIVEFTVFNPNLNLFAYAYVFFEILPSGSFLMTHRFSPFSLFEDQNSGLFLICDAIFIVFIVAFMVKEIFSIFKQKREYFKQIWNYIKWLLIVFAWVAFATYLYKLYEKNDLTDKLAKFKSSSGKNSFISFRTLNYWNDILLFCFGMCACIATVLYIKVFQFSRDISFLISVLRRTVMDMVNFMGMICIIFVGFVHLMFLTFYSRNSKYATFYRAMQESFMIIIGKVTNTCTIQFNSILEPIMILAYAMAVLIMLINLLINIVAMNYSKFRPEFLEIQRKERAIIMGYVKKNMNSLFKRKNEKTFKPENLASRPDKDGLFKRLAKQAKTAPL
jgi:hypothetical protein